jgi:hypothetical protein
MVLMNRQLQSEGNKLHAWVHLLLHVWVHLLLTLLKHAETTNLGTYIMQHQGSLRLALFMRITHNQHNY